MDWGKLGKYPDMTPENAGRAAYGALGDFAKGGNPAEAKRQQRTVLILEGAYDDYFEKHITPQGVKRADDIKSMWERFLGTLPDTPPKKHGRRRTKHDAGVD